MIFVILSCLLSYSYRLLFLFSFSGNNYVIMCKRVVDPVWPVYQTAHYITFLHMYYDLIDLCKHVEVLKCINNNINYNNS